MGREGRFADRWRRALRLKTLGQTGPGLFWTFVQSDYFVLSARCLSNRDCDFVINCCVATTSVTR